MRFLLPSAVMLCLLPSCGLILDFDPPDQLPGADSGLPALDSSFADANEHSLDAGMNTEAGSDSGFVDASPDADLDSGPPDSSLPDAGDAGPVPGCGGEPGLCLEVTEDSPEHDTAHWNYNVYYTR